jgi:hypothetical protein
MKINYPITNLVGYDNGQMLVGQHSGTMIVGALGSVKITGFHDLPEVVVVQQEPISRTIKLDPQGTTSLTLTQS